MAFCTRVLVRNRLRAATILTRGVLNMRNPISVALAVFLATSPTVASAQDAGVLDALRDGSPVVNFRLRHESVIDDRYDLHALAPTLRTILGYRTGSFSGLSFYAEAEIISAPLGDDTYHNAAGNGVSDRPTVADPVGVAMNQAYTRWSSEGTAITLGRQELVLGDSRFVGNGGWRQNHQSFDAAVLRTNVLTPIDVTYAFISEVQRVTGAQQAMRSHVGELSAQVGALGTASVHAEVIDFVDAAALSTKTIGARLAGSRSAGRSATVLYDIALATQRDAADNPTERSANYSHVNAGVAVNAATFTIGRESLGGSSEDGAFTTSLANTGKFNGWADEFLTTPTDGLVDLYLTVNTRVGAAAILATYHDFTAATGDTRYASEMNVQVMYGLASGKSLGAQVAHFMGDSLDQTLTKLWFWAAVSLH